MDNTQTQTKTRVAEGSGVAGKEFDKVVLFTLGAVALGFGLFAFASLAGAAATVGLPSLFNGWMVAVGLV